MGCRPVWNVLWWRFAFATTAAMANHWGNRSVHSPLVPQLVVSVPIGGKTSLQRFSTLGKRPSTFLCYQPWLTWGFVQKSCPEEMEKSCPGHPGAALRGNTRDNVLKRSGPVSSNGCKSHPGFLPRHFSGQEHARP